MIEFQTESQLFQCLALLYFVIKDAFLNLFFFISVLFVGLYILRLVIFADVVQQNSYELLSSEQIQQILFMLWGTY